MKRGLAPSGESPCVRKINLPNGRLQRPAAATKLSREDDRPLVRCKPLLGAATEYRLRPFSDSEVQMIALPGLEMAP